MTELDIDDVILLHKMMSKATGGASGIRDMAALESAIYHSYATFDGKDLYPAIEEKAGRQAYGIIRNHPFIDGNKRTGLFVMLVFLELNGVKLKLSQSELVWLGNRMASGRSGPSGLIKWINKHRE